MEDCLGDFVVIRETVVLIWDAKAALMRCDDSDRRHLRAIVVQCTSKLGWRTT